MDDNDDDSHLCLRCSSTIAGLENYVLHRKAHCAPTKQTPAHAQITSPSATQHYEPSSLRADDFFSSLELQSIQAVVANSAAAHKAAQVDDDFDEVDDSENELYPPRSHTGGKWKPGWRPDSSPWKSVQSPAKQTHHDPSKADDSSFYCSPCGRSFRDRYSFARHVRTPYHFKRSGEKITPCKRSSRARSSSRLSDIMDRLLDKSWPKEVEKESCRTSKNECPTLGTSRLDAHQEIGSSETHSFPCRVVDHNSYVQCVNPAEVTGQACHSKDIRPVLEGLQNEDVCSCFRHRRAGSKHRWKDSEHRTRKKGIDDGHRSEVETAPNFPLSPQAGITSSMDLEGYELQNLSAVTDTAETCQKSSGSAVKVSCPYCSKLVNKLYLKFHLFVHTGERPFQCHMCGRAFSYRSTLSTHLKHHVGMKRYQCDKCTFRAVRPSMLRRHQRSIHDLGLCRRTHVCHVCGSSYFDPQSLQQHVLRHEKRACCFTCEIPFCGKVFANLSGAKAHSRVHEGNQKLLCSTCGYSTRSVHQLTKHERRHTGEHPFKCEHCNYSASRCSQLRRHRRVHTGAKPYECPHCDYKCSSQENMRKHVLKTKKHAGKKMYQCSRCGFNSNEFSAYKDHLQNKHHARWPSSVSPLGEVTSSNTVARKSFDRGKGLADGKNEETKVSDSEDVLKVAMPQTPGEGLPVSTSSFELTRFCTSLDTMARHETLNPHPTRTEMLLPEGIPPERALPPCGQKHGINAKKRSGIVESHQSDVVKMLLPHKTTHLSDSEKENPISYVPLEVESLVGPVTPKMYGIDATPVDRSINVEHVDCVLLPDLHEQPAMLPSDQVGLAHVDGNNTVFIYMPLNGP